MVNKHPIYPDRIRKIPRQFSPKYLDFANHYGFTIAACNVGKGNEMG